MTREGDSVEAVVLHADADGALFLDPGYTMPAPLGERPLSIEAVQALLLASVRLGQGAFIRHLRERPESEVLVAWTAAAEASPSLAGLFPIVMYDRVWRDAGLALRWHDTLGLTVGD